MSKRIECLRIVGLVVIILVGVFILPHDASAASCSETVRCNYQWNYWSTDCSWGNFAYWRECSNKHSPMSCRQRNDGNGRSYRRENAGTEIRRWNCGDSYGSCYCSGSKAYRKYYRGVCGSTYPACSSSASTRRAPECDSQCCSPTNGGWSEWSNCTNAVQTRTCTNPAPSCGGAGCSGSATQTCAIELLRVQTPTGKILLAGNSEGILTSPLRVVKNGMIFGIYLVELDDPYASNIRIKTASGIKALRLYP